MKGDWDNVNLHELWATAGIAGAIGLTRLLYLIRQGRDFIWFDLLLEPMLAIVAGMLVWGLATLAGLPGIMVTVLASLGSWGGPKTIGMLEVKYLGDVVRIPGTTRVLRTAPGSLDQDNP